MAEDQDSRTEDPTGRRLGDARSRGQVAVSRDVSTLASLIAATVVIMLVLPWTLGPIVALMHSLIARPDQIDIGGNPRAIAGLMTHFAWDWALAVGVPAIILALTGVITSITQTGGLLWVTSKLSPNFSFLNPMAGIGRLFARKSLIEFAKGVVKVAIVGTAVFFVLQPEFNRVQLDIGMDPRQIIPTLLSVVFELLMTVIIALVFLAGLDFLYQRWSTLQALKMTKQEVKDEVKNAEGDPHIKGRQRQMRMSRAKRRMLQAVPNASVVVTNPTHYAVALLYDQTMSAPKVVAKGVDFLAAKIREIAEEHDVPIVQNPPVARALYATVEVDEDIPSNQYKAVAEIIGFVMRLKKRRLTRQTLDQPARVV
jgi:flagellar biosynthetic protein FlhB